MTLNLGLNTTNTLTTTSLQGSWMDNWLGMPQFQETQQMMLHMTWLLEWKCFRRRKHILLWSNKC